MKKFTLFFVIMIACLSSKAQAYVTIPDSNFVSWLTVNVPSAMSGNLLDTSSTAVTTLTTMDIADDSVFSLEGIQYFTALQYLDCSYNQLDTLTQLPDSLKTLICSTNRIAYIDAFPPALQLLRCDRNMLTSLPALPASIISFDCRENQLSLLPALPPSLPELVCSGNLLTSLPLLPASITRISCETNELDTLPSLPPSLTFLNCNNNVLSSLPAILPATLDTLLCNQNQLTALPVLPNLSVLECYENNLSALPALPSSLLYLTCSTNPLGTLPALPAGLLNLRCYSDSLTSLPVLPGSLAYLDCNTNLLTALPALPGSLNELNCSVNLLPALPVLPSSLATLNCSQNQVTAMPALASLVTLVCENNLLSTLPVIPSSLQTLYCGNNPLDSLPALASLVQLSCTNATLDSLPALPPTLSSLICSSNLLDTLPVLPASLSYLDCSVNQLTLLPVLPPAMVQLECSSNLLSSLPSIPGSLNTLSCANNLITCMPEFPNGMTSINLYGNPYTCLQNYTPAMDSVTLLKPLCVFGDLVSNPNNCPSARGIVGFTYTDNNSNCTKDSLDGNLVNIHMNVYDNAGALIGQTYTASNGVYSFVESSGTYTAMVDTTDLPFVPQCSAPGIDSTVTTTTALPLASDINFDFNCKPGFDLGIHSIFPQGLIFPGQIHELRVVAGDETQWYNMACASGVSGTVQVKVQGPLSYVGPAAGALTPVVTGNIYTYSIADFGAIVNTQAFRMLFKTDTTALANDDISVEANITPIGGDNKPSNNAWVFHYLVSNSHDPNFKETTPRIVTPAYEDYFTYGVHFQNTGNAPAINIAIADTLDNNLDPATFQLINFSHPNTVNITGNVLHISFPNIMLADSTSSADSSIGFFQYRIKAKPHRPMGTHIYNTAFIYFDYNEAVITNTTINMYEGSMPLSVTDTQKDPDWSIYPNPASGHVIVQYGRNAEMKICDVTGRVVRERIQLEQDTQEISLEGFEKGLYFVTITEGNQSSTKKFVKQ
jgi:uncharacterized repeat protein (TIGR01451 family)